MIQIKAAARLKVMAGELDKAEARKYLKTLGLSLGRQEKIAGQPSHWFTFLLNDEPADAVKTLTQKLKVKADKEPGKSWSFDTSDYRRIHVWEDRHGRHVSLISLK